MWNWITQNIETIGLLVAFLGILITLVSLAISGYRYVTVRRDELDAQRFEKYHKLIRDVSTGYDESGRIKLVSQIAYIYELRHFKKYREVTIRVLKSLRNDWQENPNHNPMLSHEVDLTLNELKRFWDNEDELPIKKQSLKVQHDDSAA